MRTPFLAVVVALLSLGGCASSPAKAASATTARLGTEKILSYEHIDGFGTRTETPAWLAWEFEAQGYVKYQVVYTSCTCRQESINILSMLYVEVTKEGPDSRIKNLYFHFWGDSPVTPAGNTREQMEKEYMAKLPGKSKADVDSVDVITGATVTTINLRQIANAVLDYHVKHYPEDSGMEVPIGPDALSGATE